MSSNHIIQKEKTRKRFNLPAAVLLLLLVFAVASTGLMETAYAKTAGDDSAVSETAANVKNGIRKENGKYYYYVDGKKQKSQWVKTEGKTYYLKKDGSAAVASCKIDGSYYIFSEKGVLYKSAKKKIVTVKGKKYLVKKNGKACVGTVIIDGKFYISGKTGKYLSDKSKKLRKAAKANKPMTPVYQLIGKPKKSQYENGCYSMKDPKTGKYISGKDGILTYQNIYVYTMKAADGREFFIGAESKE